VLGKPIKVTTLLELNADERIGEISVMVRPLTAVVAFAEAIATACPACTCLGERLVTASLSRRRPRAA
jgi:hypothetical protein